MCAGNALMLNRGIRFEVTRRKEHRKMKLAIAIMCAMFGLICVGNAEETKITCTWTNNWSAFVKELSGQVAKDNYFVGNVNSAFSGKRVEWNGTVTEIKRPEKSDESGLIRLSMKTETLVMKSGSPILDRLVMTPDGDEWATWETVSVGSVVVFATTLDEGEFVPKCVLSKMDGMGANAGTVRAWINTKGGSCRKVIGQDKK